MTEERRRVTIAIRDTLYNRFFAKTSQAGSKEKPISVDEFARRLAAANRGRDAWLYGWSVREIRPGGLLIVSQGERLRFVKAGDYAMTLAEDVPLCIGCGVMIHVRKESLGLQEGTYCALGEESPSPDEEADVLRIYFNAAEEAAVSLVQLVTKYFNEWAVPFSLKVMLRPEDRGRTDATVLYLPKNYYRNFVQLLSEFPAPLFRNLREEVPLFTKRLRSGIGLAESPAGAESFGLHRCRLVAEGIVDASLAGYQDVSATNQAIEKRFASEGFSLSLPYLNPGSKDIYSTNLEDCPPAQNFRRVERNPPVLTVKNVLAFMRERGLCTETDVQWQISEYPRRNRNFGIIREDNGCGFFVKQLRVRDPESRAMLRREATVYQLAQQNPDFAALKQFTPAFVAYDDESEVLVLDFLNGENLLKAHERLQRFPEEFAHSLGVALATLHNRVGTTTSGAPPREIFPMKPPGIFDAHRNGPLMRWLGPGQRLLVTQVREQLELAQTLDELAASWRCETFIHGDLKFENCMTPDPESRSQVVLLDWELADFGDPAWDIGSVLHCYLIGNFTEPPLKTFWQSYCEEAHLVQEKSARVLLERSLACAAARMIQTALEVMRGQDQPTQPALKLFNTSIELIARKQNIFLD